MCSDVVTDADPGRSVHVLSVGYKLRHQSFLWAHDLSTYDAIVSWNTYIPIITPYFGNHISLFCLLMTVTNIIYTKFNMDQTNTGQQQMPGMKAMMYMMPLMMLVFFNQYASGLTYYYFISTLITILQTVIFRYTINEDKLLAKLEENKKKADEEVRFHETFGRSPESSTGPVGKTETTAGE